MLQRYKLRLGDGTVLLVDRDSLGTWLVDRGATVQSDTSGRWRPLKEVVARERAAARRESRRRPSVHESRPPARASAPRDESDPLAPPPRADGLPLVPPPPKRETSAGLPTPSARADGLPLVFPPGWNGRSETPVPTPVVEPRPPAVSPAVPEIPREAAGLAPAAATPPTGAAALLPTAEDSQAFSFDPATLVEPASDAVDAVEPAAGDLPPTVIVGAPQTLLLGDDDVEVIDTLPGVEPAVTARHEADGEALEVQTVADALRTAEPAQDEAEAIRELPVIPLKPVGASREQRPAREPNGAREQRPPGRASDVARTTNRPGTDHGTRPGEDAPAWVGDSRVSAALGWAGALGGVLSRGLEPLNRLERGMPPIVVEEGALTRARNAIRRRLDGAGERLGTAWTRIGRRAHRLDALPTEPIAAPPSIERTFRPAPVLPPRPTPALPPRPDPEPPPPPLERLAVLPVADALEIPAVEDVYEDGETDDLLPRLSQWAKLLALLTTLAAAGLLAVLSWQSWFPTAGHVGQMAFAEIDRHARAGERAEQQRRILEEAAERLPFLAPETVQLILSRSPAGVLEVPDIFETACDAADWGSWALRPAEADELRQLRRMAIGRLGPVDRARVDEYEHARATGLVFPLDNRLGALLWARGARGLPPAGQERLRELLGKAITAGISPASVEASRTRGP